MEILREYFCCRSVYINVKVNCPINLRFLNNKTYLNISWQNQDLSEHKTS